MYRTVVAAAAAAVVLAGCGSTAQHAATAAAASPAAAAHAVPLTCKQKSDAWRKANLGTLRRFVHSLAPFRSGSVTSAQARALTRDSGRAEDVPPPACADPKGYYGQALAELQTAGSAASGGGDLSMLGAMAPIEDASTDLNELGAELRSTVGSGGL